jgi:hypothetical protein
MAPSFLKDQQQRPAILCVELFLHLAGHGAALLDQLLGMFFGFHAVGVGWVEILEAELITLRNTIGRGEATCFLQKFAVFHDRRSLVQRLAWG